MKALLHHTWKRCYVCRRSIWSEEDGDVALHFTNVGPYGERCDGSGLPGVDDKQGAQA